MVGSVHNNNYSVQQTPAAEKPVLKGDVKGARNIFEQKAKDTLAAPVAPKRKPAGQVKKLVVPAKTETTTTTTASAPVVPTERKLPPPPPLTDILPPPPPANYPELTAEDLKAMTNLPPPPADVMPPSRMAWIGNALYNVATLGGRIGGKKEAAEAPKVEEKKVGENKTSSVASTLYSYVPSMPKVSMPSMPKVSMPSMPSMSGVCAPVTRRFKAEKDVAAPVAAKKEKPPVPPQSAKPKVDVQPAPIQNTEDKGANNELAAKLARRRELNGEK